MGGNQLAALSGGSLLQIPIPGGDQLVAISEQGVAAILALAFVLMFLAVLLGIWIYGQGQDRQAKRAAAELDAEAKSDHAASTQTLELTKTIAALVNADQAKVAAMQQQGDIMRRQLDATEALVKSFNDQSLLMRQFIEKAALASAEHERISRAVAAEAVEAVMAELGDIKGRLRGTLMLERLDAVAVMLAKVEKLLRETPPTALLPVSVETEPPVKPAEGA